MNRTKRFTLGTLTGSSTVLLKTAINFAIIPILIQFLGTESWGLYVLLFSVVEFSMMLDLGFGNALTKVLGSQQAIETQQEVSGLSPAIPGISVSPNTEHLKLLKIGNFFYGGLAVFVLVGGLLSIDAIIHFLKIPQALKIVAQKSLLVAIVIGALNLYNSYFRSILSAHCKHYWINLAEFLAQVLGNLVGVVVLLGHHQLFGFMCAHLGSNLLMTAILFYQAWRTEPQLLVQRVSVSFSTLKELVSLSIHSVLVQFSVILSHKVDNFVIAAYLPLRFLGVFEVVFRLLNLSSQVSLKLSQGLMPIYAHLLAQQNYADARRYFLTMSHVMSIITGWMILVTAGCYPELLDLISGGQFTVAQTWPIFVIGSGIIFTGAMQMPASSFLFTAGEHRYLSFTSLITAFFNVGLSMLWVQSIGLVGVALGTLIPQGIQHQGLLIRRACNMLKIPVGNYLFQVHGRSFIPWLATAMWLGVCRRVILVEETSIYLLAANVVGSGFIGIFCWFCFSATLEEKQRFATLAAGFLPKKQQAPTV